MLPGPLKEYAANGADRPGSMVTVLQGHVESLNLSEEIDRLFADEWTRGSIFVDFLEATGATDIEIGPWLPSGDECIHAAGRSGVREVHCRVPAPRIPLCPVTTRMSITYALSTLLELGHESLQADITSVVHDVPYCDHFVVQDRTAMMCCGNGTVVSKAVSVLFVKSTMLKSKISSNTVIEQQKAGEAFLEILSRRCQEDVAGLPKTCAQASLPPSPTASVRSAGRSLGCEATPSGTVTPSGTPRSVCSDRSSASSMRHVAQPPLEPRKQGGEAVAVRQMRQQRFHRGAGGAKPSRGPSTCWGRLLAVALSLLALAAALAHLAGTPAVEATPPREAPSALGSVPAAVPTTMKAWLFSLSAVCFLLYPCGLLLWTVREGQAAAPKEQTTLASSKVTPVAVKKLEGLETPPVHLGLARRSTRSQTWGAPCSTGSED